MSSSGAVNLQNCVIKTSASPAIGGAGVGVLGLANVTFTDNSVVAGTVTIGTAGGLFPPGNLGSAGFVWTSNGPGVCPTFQPDTNRLTWTAISASQALVVNNGYFCTGGAGLSLSLPAVSSVGDTIEIVLDGSTSWTITQPNAATRIRIGNTQTTLGVGGTLASTQQGDTIKLVCETVNARWSVTSMIGNITVV